MENLWRGGILLVTIPYIVKQGDTLWLIAKKNGISLDSLIAANPQIADPDKIDVGWCINIPTNSGGMKSMPMPMHYEAPSPMQQQHAEMPHTMGHLVKAGETLWLIAKKHGIMLEDLIKFNPQIKDPNKIDIGQNINIPSKMGTHPPKYYPIATQPPKYCPMPTMQPMPMHPMPTMHPMTPIPSMPHVIHHIHYMCACCPPEIMQMHCMPCVEKEKCMHKHEKHKCESKEKHHHKD